MILQVFPHRTISTLDDALQYSYYLSSTYRTLVSFSDRSIRNIPLIYLCSRRTGPTQT